MKTIATEAARIAGDILRHYFTRPLNVQTKSNAFDLVTQADFEADAAITNFIAQKCPGHAFWTEENGESSPGAEYIWLVDPLDGTTNFVHRYPHFCVAIALLHHQKPVLAVTFDPVRDELFLAEKGGGATLNGVPISVSTTASFTGALLASGFAPLRNDESASNLARVRTAIQKTHGFRDSGSAALNMAYVAAGRLDGYWALRLSPWDWVGGALIVEEAGGTVSALPNGDWSVSSVGMLASNGALHSALLEMLA